MSTVYVIENGVVISSFCGYATTAGQYKPATKEEEKRLLENSERIEALRLISDSLDDILQKSAAERKVAAMQRLDALQTFCKQIESYGKENTANYEEAVSLPEIWDALKILGEKDFTAMTNEGIGMVERELEKLYDQIKTRPEAMLYSRKVQMEHMKKNLGKNGWRTTEVIHNENKACMMVQTLRKDKAVIVFGQDGRVTVLSDVNDSIHQQLQQLVEASLRSLYPNIKAQGTCMHGIEAKKEESKILQIVRSGKKNVKNTAGQL